VGEARTAHIFIDSDIITPDPTAEKRFSVKWAML
jgi:hypothetical protein